MAQRIDPEILRRILWAGFWADDGGAGGTPPPPPTPGTGSFVDLSWSGNTSVFNFDVPSGTANTYNSLVRNGTATNFADRTIESVQTVAQGTPFVFSADMVTSANVWYLVFNWANRASRTRY